MMDQPKRLQGNCLQRNYWATFRPLYLAAASIALLSLSACSVIASAAKEGALSVTGRSGWKTFNLTGELPPEFGIKAVVWYAPIAPSASCEKNDIYSDKKRTRTHAQVFEKDYNPQAHTFNFKVPLTYSIGLCAMEIARVDMRIRGRFGNKDWQTSYDDGGLRFVESHPIDSPHINENENKSLVITGKCEWWFQDMRARGQLSKLLNCKGVGAYLNTNRLSNKTVELQIQVSPDETPYRDDTWIKFPNGWKPCELDKDGWNWCQIPPIFKTFKMNDQTCTIYPGCTE
jgi:hypothetical protein